MKRSRLAKGSPYSNCYGIEDGAPSFFTLDYLNAESLHDVRLCSALDLPPCKGLFKSARIRFELGMFVVPRAEKHPFTLLTQCTPLQEAAFKLPGSTSKSVQ
jgi:hypothetical protein